VDVYATTGSADLTGLTPLASNISFEAVSPYALYPAGPIRVIVTAAGDPGTVLYDFRGTGTPVAGDAWTIILMYNAGNGLDEPLTTLVIKDRCAPWRPHGDSC